jgi:aspartyl-tRNA(Asn)/glutamyl-tRNA(Gln) amidotransferase subunit B
MEFEPVIGLEIHAQLATDSKLFCGCSTEFGLAANANTCPVCMGLPGVLPVLNRRAVEFAVRLGLATHCEIRLDSQFARKNYFYPDLPKAYQISQYDRPLCEHGWLEIHVDGKPKRIGITRIHMEEDAGKLVHEGADPSASYVDLNRAGVPLVEIVSEPELSSPEEARRYMEKIHSLVTYLEVSDGNMERGNLRADVNISLRPSGTTELGTRTETKNLNSFRFVQAALEYEIGRQREELLEGHPIVLETRLYDPMSKTTYAMRSKEEAHDYRYFPEPDLPKAYQISQYDRPLCEHGWLEIHVDGKPKRIGITTAEFYEAVVAAGASAKRASNWVSGDLAARFNAEKTTVRDLKFPPPHLAALIDLIEKGEISGKIAKEVFDTLYETGQHPAEIVKEKGFEQVSDVGELEGIVAQVVADNPAQVEQFKSGREKVFGFFVGQVMKATRGQANPAIVNDLLRKKLA